MKEVHVWDRTLSGKMAVDAAVARHCSLSKFIESEGHALIILGCGSRDRIENIVHETILSVFKTGTTAHLPEHKLSLFVAEATIAIANKQLNHLIAADIFCNAGMTGLKESHVTQFCNRYAMAYMKLVDFRNSAGSNVLTDMIHRARRILWIQALTFFTSHPLVWVKPPDQEVPT
ncbi:hypothetical protein BH11PAT2_BH11PAT2_05860 [soil metagenome]